MRNIKLTSLAPVLLTLAGVSSANAELVVIVNPKNSAALSVEQIGALYLGNAAAFPDGSPVALADLPEAAEQRGAFYQKATGRSVSQVKAAWARIVFTGKGTPPKELKSEAEVKAFVASEPKAIGYIDSSAVDGSVKVAAKL